MGGMSVKHDTLSCYHTFLSFLKVCTLNSLQLPVHPLAYFLDCWRKPESPAETHTDIQNSTETGTPDQTRSREP